MRRTSRPQGALSSAAKPPSTTHIFRDMIAEDMLNSNRDNMIGGLGTTVEIDESMHTVELIKGKLDISEEEKKILELRIKFI